MATGYEDIDRLTIDSVVEFEGLIVASEYVKLNGMEMYPDTYTEYYLCKDNGNSNGWDFIYSSECGYEMRASEKTYPVWIGVSMDWDCDLGITYFSGFWECWYGGLMEIDS